jgi:hypothetical protein
VFTLANSRTCLVWDYISGRPFRSHSLCCQNFAILVTGISILLKIFCESGRCNIGPNLCCYAARDKNYMPIKGAARSKVWICDLSIFGIVGSNPTREHGYLSLVCGIIKERSLRHSSRKVIPSVARLSMNITSG